MGRGEGGVRAAGRLRVYGSGTIFDPPLLKVLPTSVVWNEAPGSPTSPHLRVWNQAAACSSPAPIFGGAGCPA